ncbi:MAG TPA: long-chain fatty acid--CoA ligase [Myxococcota bacterium]|nr:long-chain fatty acid--CoA ligase [Myxococcota bacterium]
MKPVNVGEVPGPYNLVEVFEEATKKFADLELFGTKDVGSGEYRWVTYRQVAERVDKLRGGLAGLGVGPGDGVAIISNNRVEWAVAAYASYGRGARFVPMYEAELTRIWKYIISDSGCKLLFVATPEIAAKVAPFVDEIDSLEYIVLLDGDGHDSMADLERRGAEQPVESTHPDGEDIAGLIYTSGTTGNPKGVLLSHRNLSSNVLAIFDARPGNIGPGDRTLSFLPWAHSFGQIAELHLLVHAGASTGFAESPKTIIDDIGIVRPTILVAVPRIFNKIYEGLHKKMAERGGLSKFLFEMGKAAAIAKREGRGGLLNGLKLAIADRLVFSKIRQRFGGRLKLAMSSSAALNRKIAEFFHDVGVPAYEAWGMTELSPAHTLNLPEANKFGSVGRPILGSWVEIDRSLTGPDSKDGEIIAYGPNVMVGYHNLPEETAKVLRQDGGLRTGDRGWVDEDGFMFITGRIKEQYKLENGKYIFPSELEEAIKLSSFIEHCMLEGANRAFNVALVVPDFEVLEAWATKQGLSAEREALVTKKEIVALIEEEVRKYCSEFARYEVPRKVLVVSESFTTENGILTPTLKLKRREVNKRYGEKIAALFG